MVPGMRGWILTREGGFYVEVSNSVEIERRL